MTEPIQFSTLKRRAYLATLPFIALISLLTVGVGITLDQTTPFDIVALPILAGLLLLAEGAIYLERPKLATVEYYIYSVVSLVFVSKFTYSLFVKNVGSGNASGLTQIYIWTPILFILAFLLFEQKPALVGATSVFSLTFIAGTVHAIAYQGSDVPPIPSYLIEYYLANGLTLGLLYVFSNLRSRITTLREQVQHMERLANLDVLTSTPNRRHLEDILKRAILEVERYASPVSIISLDIDHFKQINDAHGHATGDQVLMRVAELFSDFIRETDSFGRWGGEEFLIITAKTDLRGTMLLAERLRTLLCNYEFTGVGKVTASFGVASYKHGDTVESLIKRADEALYLSKANGRNRVEAITREIVKHMSIPELYNPFVMPDKVDERAETLNRATLSWISSFSLAKKRQLYDIVSAVSPGWLASNIHPDGSSETLAIISDWYLWMFLYDDYCDESELGKNPEQLRNYNAKLLTVLRGASRASKEDPISLLIEDLGRRFRTLGKDDWMARFTSSVKEFFEATVWEASNRFEERPPDLASYIEMRPKAAGLMVDGMFIEMADGVSLTETQLELDIVKDLRRLANLLVCWANDIFSLNKEVHHNDVHNLVLALQHEQRLTLLDALERATQMHDEAVKEFVTRKLDLPDDPVLSRYAELLEARIRSNIEWSKTALRYQQFESVRVV